MRENKGQQEQDWDISGSHLFYGEKYLSLQMWRDVMLWTSSCLWWKTFFIVSQRCSNWICLISSASLFHSCISSQETLSLAFCTFCSGLCDQCCHEEEISLTVQPVQRWRAGLQCTRRCTNYSKDGPRGPELGGEGELEQVEIMGWFVAGGVRQRSKSQGSRCFWFLFLLSYCVWIMDTVHTSDRTCLGITGAFSLSYCIV